MKQVRISKAASDASRMIDAASLKLFASPPAPALFHV